ncbi:MAG TPA: methionyl-tRNA formyltransferase [Stenotrophobium sp.]|jgi:methionyl-tRNA formyltransferase|nr:methionyl-tRNA formyltransferase [Stenotrophobium sp.]
MRLAFAGTPEFAVAALDALHAAGHDIAGVFTQPDRPAGRGQKLSASPVARRAEALNIPTFKPQKLDAAAQDDLRMLRPELLVVVAYGLILPQAVLGIPRHGCFNIHASLLPRWRGAAPIQRAILAGDAETGITIMRMDAGLDTGPMLLREAIPITAETTAASLHDALAVLGGRLVVEALARLARDELHEQAQPAEGHSYARKISKDEARLDWSLSAEQLARRVRAYNPMPIAWTELDGERVRIHAAVAEPGNAAAEPGSVIEADDDGVRVACGGGLLNILRLQWPGGRVLGAAEAAHGKSLADRRFR